MKEKPLISIDFDDGSVFEMPGKWEEVLLTKHQVDSVDELGEEELELLTQRLQWLTGKYYENNAYPTKFDGLTTDPEAVLGDEKYDEPDYYWSVGEEGLVGDSKELVMAEIAKRLMYLNLRPLLMQQALNEIAQEKDEEPIEIITLADLLIMLDEKD